MLTLPIDRKWFRMIKSGEKKEEYREIKPYWTSRFERFLQINKYPTAFDITLRNGYAHNSPSIKCKVTVRIGTGKPEWGAEPNKEYYVLEILEILEG